MTGDHLRVEVERHFAAAPEQVFAAFAEARWVARWLSPSPEIKLALLEFDFREGGAYRFAYHLSEGQTVIVRGVYRSIEPPSKIIFSWIIEPPDPHAGIDSEVTVTIIRDGAGTQLIIRHEKLGRSDAVERHSQGWNGALDQLSTLLEKEGFPL